MARAPGETLFCLLAGMSFLMVAAGQELQCPINKELNTDDNSEVAVTWNFPSQSGISEDSCSPSRGSVFPIGLTRVTCSAKYMDQTVTCTFWVTVNDNHAPKFACEGLDVRKTIPNFSPMDDLSAPAVTWEAPAVTDNANPPPRPSYTHQSGAEFSLGSTAVRYTARDNSGNTDTCSFNVRVVVQPPKNHMFTKSATPDGFTVVWPQAEDGGVEEYNLLVWKKGSQRPDESQRIPVMPSNEQKQYTYLEYEITGRDPAELYTVEVSGDTGVIASAEQWTEPMPPTDLEVSILSPSSLELSWTASPGNVEQYRISAPNVEDFYVPMATDRVTLDSLDPGLMSSNVYVYAVVGSGTKRLSAPASISFTTGPVNASQLIAYRYTESTIAVRWKDSTSTADANEPHMLLINPPDAQKNYQTVFGTQPGGTYSTEFKGLKPNTEYQIRLISNLGLSLQTSQKTRPSRVSNLRPTVVANDSITLEWDPPTEGAVSSYEVEVSPAGTQNPPAMKSDTSRVFVDLKYGTEYSFQVVSVQDDMKSVPVTLMVTAGITKAVTEPLNKEAVIVGSVLGAVVLALAIVLAATYIKYRGLKSQAERTGPRTEVTGHTNDFVQNEARYNENEGQSGDVDLYELPKTHTTDYENTVVGQQSSGSAPKPKPKPKFGRR